ncbi:hypothetical protein EJB05_27720, partial [Eragrostis curvula]
LLSAATQQASRKIQAPARQPRPHPLASHPDPSRRSRRRPPPSRSFGRILAAGSLPPSPEPCAAVPMLRPARFDPWTSPRRPFTFSRTLLPDRSFAQWLTPGRFHSFVPYLRCSNTRRQTVTAFLRIYVVYIDLLCAALGEVYKCFPHPWLLPYCCSNGRVQATMTMNLEKVRTCDYYRSLAQVESNYFNRIDLHDNQIYMPNGQTNVSIKSALLLDCFFTASLGER